MAATGQPWESNPEYVSSCNKNGTAFDPTSYVVPEIPWRHGRSFTDTTSFILGQARWSEDNLPDIAFVLEPSQEWVTFKDSPRPAAKRDEKGRIMFEEFPEPGQAPRVLLDFPILPNKISSIVHWYRPELWRRYDGRIGWEDILMRMGPNRPGSGTLQMRIGRGRERFGMLSWHGSLVDSRNTREKRAKILENLTAFQIINNTTRGTTPGLINLALGELGGRIPVVELQRGRRGRRLPPPVLHGMSLDQERPTRHSAPLSSQTQCSQGTPRRSDRRSLLVTPKTGSRPRRLNQNQVGFGSEGADDGSDAGTLSRAGWRQINYQLKDETIKSVSDDDTSGESGSRSAFAYHDRDETDPLSYLPVPGIDFQNFVESLFPSKIKREATSQKTQVEELPKYDQSANTQEDEMEPLSYLSVPGIDSQNFVESLSPNTIAQETTPQRNQVQELPKYDQSANPQANEMNPLSNLPVPGIDFQNFVESLFPSTTVQETTAPKNQIQELPKYDQSANTQDLSESDVPPTNGSYSATIESNQDSFVQQPWSDGVPSNVDYTEFNIRTHQHIATAFGQAHTNCNPRRSGTSPTGNKNSSIIKDEEPSSSEAMDPTSQSAIAAAEEEFKSEIMGSRNEVPARLARNRQRMYENENMAPTPPTSQISPIRRKRQSLQVDSEMRKRQLRYHPGAGFSTDASTASPKAAAVGTVQQQSATEDEFNFEDFFDMQKYLSEDEFNFDDFFDMQKYLSED